MMIIYDDNDGNDDNDDDDNDADDDNDDDHEDNDDNDDDDDVRQELPASLRTPQNPFHYRRRQEPPVSLRIPQNPSDCLPVWRRQRNIIVTFALSNVSSSKTRRRIDKQSPELCSVFVVVGVLLTTEFAIVFVVVGFC